MYLHYFCIITDSDDDNVQIVIDQERIDEAKTSIGHNFGIKPSSRTLPSERKGRFNVEDFDQPGTIDGQTAHEVDVENLEEKPWRKPGMIYYDFFFLKPKTDAIIFQVLISRTISIMGLQKKLGQLIVLVKSECESMKVVLECQAIQTLTLPIKISAQSLKMVAQYRFLVTI